MSELAEIITGEIEHCGAISFARFMELALYCPVYGYYEKEEDTPGRTGDYFTSVSVGGLFGQLLAFQFAQWLDSPPPWLQNPIPMVQRSHPPAPSQHRLQIAEAGAHRGDLAADILTWMRDRRPELFQRLEYWIIEPSRRRRHWQRQTLAPFADKVRWFGNLSELGSPQPCAPVRGIIFCNELLDAMPVRRLTWDAKARVWFECGVTLKHGQFVWTRLPHDQSSDHTPAAQGPQPSSSLHSPAPLQPPDPLAFLPKAAPPELLDFLPDGFTTEICPAAGDWWRAAAAALAGGRLLTLDYGLSAHEFFRPERKAGTLRAYRNHKVHSDVLAQPGSQDITAHVNFTALQTAGHTLGLQTETFAFQEKFLTDIAAQAWKHERAPGQWTSDRLRQFQTLTHPDHLGRAFRVLVQSRPPPPTELEKPASTQPPARSLRCCPPSRRTTANLRPPAVFQAQNPRKESSKKIAKPVDTLLPVP